MGAVSVPPAASFFLCFWPQAAVCYLFFNLVANSVKGWIIGKIGKYLTYARDLFTLKDIPFASLNTRNSIMSEASLEKWLSHHLIFLSFLWLMFCNHLKSLCFKDHLALPFRNIFATIKILLEEISKWQREC